MGDDLSEELERCQRRIGTTLLDKWRLDSLLGVGGMAAVYAASHRAGMRAAIKVLHPHIAVSKEMRARFEQEALAITKLGHPGTVQVLDIDVTPDGAPFMVMEMLDGESLGQRVFRERPTQGEVLGFVETILDVLDAAHAAGIVHRDIKPDNLFITTDGRVKVLDFGIARMKEGPSSVRTRTGAMLGTTSYMAPEQVHGRGVDGRVDVFAVGATMFRVLSGKRLHEAESDAELLILMGSTPAPAFSSVAPDVDPRVAGIIDRALAFDRERRYPDAKTMLADVRAAMQDREPPFAAAAFAAAGAPTRAEGSPPSSAGSVVVSPPSSRGDAPPSRALGEAPTMHALAAPTVEPSRTAGPLSDRRTSITFAVGIGATMILFGGFVALSFFVGDCRSKPSTASDAEEQRKSNGSDDESRPAKKKLRGEELDREVSKYVEDSEKEKGKGKKKKKKKKHERVEEEPVEEPVEESVEP